jgi:type II secretory pathway pseudopilin PulG
MKLSKTLLMSGAAIAVLAAPAIAEDRSTMKQKEQYLYQQSQDNGLNADQNAIGATKPGSGPGVQGAPDTRTGPATHSQNKDGSASSGASSGDSGTGTMNNAGDAATQPSQDSSGVQGFPDTRTGPSTRSPDDASGGASGSGQ